MNQQPIFTIAALYAAALAGIRNQNYERAVDGGSCVYRSANNTKCALGHGVSDELMRQAGHVEPNVNGARAYGLFRALKHRYTDNALFGVVGFLEVEQFASRLQSLHDSTLDPSRVPYLDVVDGDLDFGTSPAVSRARAIAAWENDMRKLADMYAEHGCVYTEPTPAEATA